MHEGESTDSRPEPRWVRWGCGAVLVVAAVVRFVGLGHELRAGSGPMIDEVHNFVEPTLMMWTRHSPDPTVYTGYAGFFNYLIFFPVGLGHRLAGHAGAYIGARAFIALVSLLSVILVYALLRRIAGNGPALFAACLLTLSRGEIREAHQVSPDVVVVALMLGFFLVLSNERVGAWRAIVAATLVGVATAVKYTGILLLPGLVVGLWINRIPRRATGLALLAAMTAFALAAPYAILAAASGGGRHGIGFLSAVMDYYGARPYENRFASTGVLALGSLKALLELNLGWVAAVLALGGLLFYRPTRHVLPAGSIALVSAVALAAANHFYARHGLLLGATATVLAACGLASVERLIRPRRGVVVALAVAALAMPAWTAMRLVRGYVEGAPAEKAAQWLDGHGAPKTSVVTSWPVLGVDRARFEVLRVSSFDAMSRAAIESFSLILTSTQAEASRLAETADVVETFAPHVVLLRPRRAPEWQQVPPPTGVNASEHAESAQAAWDGDRKTLWVGSSRESWLEARWQQPVVVDAVEIDAGKEGLWPRDLRLDVLESDGLWRALDVLPLRPLEREEQRQGSRPGQFFLLDHARTIGALRITRVGSTTRWGLAEVRPLAAQYH